jgi:3-hydroxyacyl-[acyl-carrier-protein] dehydratase
MAEDVLTMALEALPHGPEFRFIDALVALDPGRSGRATYQVRGDEPFLAGHFPGQPLMPGVILVEAVAQLAGVIAQSDPAVAPLPDLRLAAVRSARITGSAGPGAALAIEAEVVARLGRLIQASGRVIHEGREILTAQVTLVGGGGR